MKSKKNIPLTDIRQGAMMEIRPLLPTIDRTKDNETPHRHVFQEIIYVQSGKGYHSIDGQVFRLQANTIYLIRQGQVHLFQKGENLKGYLLRYKEDLLPPKLTFYSKDYSLLQMLTNSNALSLSKTEATIFSNNFEELLLENSLAQNSPNGQNADIIQLVLLTILSRIKLKIRNSYEQDITNELNSDKAFAQRLILLIEDHYKEEHDLPFYYKKLGLNNRKLLAITQTQLGKTPKQLINQRIITEATRLLKFTDLNLKEISFELGYDEPAYFSRIFKNKIGVSPRAYRKIPNFK